MQDADPDNREASRMVAALVIERSRQQAGLPPRNELDLRQRHVASAGSNGGQPSTTPSRSGSYSEFDSLIPSTGIRLTRIQQLETAIKDEAANADVFLELAQLYLDKGREYEAERLLARAREATGRDPRILSLGEDVTMSRLDKKVTARAARRRARGDARCPDGAGAARQGARPSRDRHFPAADRPRTRQPRSAVRARLPA